MLWNWPIGDVLHAPSIRARAQAHGIGAPVDSGVVSSLGQNVGDHLIGRTVLELHTFGRYPLAYCMPANVNVFRARMVDWIASKTDRSLIITIHGGW
jgi:hypothetical protein